MYYNKYVYYWPEVSLAKLKSGLKVASASVLGASPCDDKDTSACCWRGDWNWVSIEGVAAGEGILLPSEEVQVVAAGRVGPEGDKALITVGEDIIGDGQLGIGEVKLLVLTGDNICAGELLRMACGWAEFCLNNCVWQSRGGLMAVPLARTCLERISVSLDNGEFPSGNETTGIDVCPTDDNNDTWSLVFGEMQGCGRPEWLGTAVTIGADRDRWKSNGKILGDCLVSWCVANRKAESKLVLSTHLGLEAWETSSIVGISLTDGDLQRTGRGTTNRGEWLCVTRANGDEKLSRGDIGPQVLTDFTALNEVATAEWTDLGFTLLDWTLDKLEEVAESDWPLMTPLLAPDGGETNLLGAKVVGISCCCDCLE